MINRDKLREAIVKFLEENGWFLADSGAYWDEAWLDIHDLAEFIMTSDVEEK